MSQESVYFESPSMVRLPESLSLNKVLKTSWTSVIYASFLFLLLIFFLITWPWNVSYTWPLWFLSILPILASPSAASICQKKGIRNQDHSCFNKLHRLSPSSLVRTLIFFSFNLQTTWWSPLHCGLIIFDHYQAPTSISDLKTIINPLIFT